MITPVTPLLEAQTLECSQFINPFSLRVLATQLRNFGISILSSSPPFNHHGVTSNNESAKKVEIGNIVDYHHYRPLPTSEVALPKDWSY
ncbi:uncharacterized protein [Spinacia oleracea]|uniref:Uncharacterized protein isoform X2 n=1 Tax=Spinacia oleracea TaxID=3562 RepID=A0ABM3QKZ9_SPIOL|nr:uncharacterized protein LOC110775651 isoform X2 [Spinacia oleracea]